MLICCHVDRSCIQFGFCDPEGLFDPGQPFIDLPDLDVRHVQLTCDDGIIPIVVLAGCFSFFVPLFRFLSLLLSSSEKYFVSVLTNIRCLRISSACLLLLWWKTIGGDHWCLIWSFIRIFLLICSIYQMRISIPSAMKIKMGRPSFSSRSSLILLTVLLVEIRI